MAAHPAADARLDRRLGAALPRDGARPRPDRDRDRRARADRRLLLVPVGRRGRGARATTKATVVAHDGLRYDLRVVPPESYGNLLQHFTGSKDAQRRAARGGRAARALGLRVRDRRGRDAARCTRSRPRRRSTRFLGYEWIPPELRENGGELEAARNGELPKLVELGDLRGDLHTHTTWSDGKDTLEAMVAPRGREGLRLLRDLRPLAAAARRAARSSRREAIDALNERVPLSDPQGDRGEHPRRTASSTSPTRTLAGARLGRRVGAQLASTRTRPSACWRRWRTRTSTASATSRTARSASAPPSEVDVERVIEKALETGTFLEINSQPDRLDLTDVHARAAREAGLKLVDRLRRRTSSRRSTTSSSASARRGARG